ncbi:MAG: hypothetical protein HZB72_05735 [Burkholderiales bacterium]|nr:hypothetical protein [Burkholderiales bacterium]
MSPADAPPPSAAQGSFADAFAEPIKAAMSFGKFVPGFDFLEQWTRQAHAALPSMGQWVAPTLDPAELEKRIQDLRTVQFWLEQNARMLGMTIQALEVQRMTLATLQGMNVPVDALRESLKARPAPGGSAGSAAAGASGASGASAAGTSTSAGTSAAGTSAAGSSAGGPATAGPAAAFPFGSPAAAAATGEPASATDSSPAEPPAAVDPMRWWGALTQQFTQLAASTMQDALGRERPPAAPDPAEPAPPAARPRASSHPAGGASAAGGDAASTDAPRPPRAKARSGTAADKPARR